MYKIVVLIGKSGSGKDRLLRELTINNSFHEIVSNTTRPIRENEKDGVNYHFLTEEEFFEKERNNQMLEVSHFREWHYGTSFDNLNENKINIGVYNPTGYISLLENPNVEVLGVYVDCSDKERLIRQLNREEHPDVEEIVRRFSTDKADFDYLNNYLLHKFSHLYEVRVNNDKGTDIKNIADKIIELVEDWDKKNGADK